MITRLALASTPLILLALGACGAQERTDAQLQSSEVWIVTTDDYDDIDFARASVERQRDAGKIAHVVIATHDSGVQSCRINRTNYANDELGVIELPYYINAPFGTTTDTEGIFIIDATPAPGATLPKNWRAGHDHEVRDQGTAPTGVITLPLLPIETSEIRIHWSTQ
jgi:hypothetical protein